MVATVLVAVETDEIHAPRVAVMVTVELPSTLRSPPGMAPFNELTVTEPLPAVPFHDKMYPVGTTPVVAVFGCGQLKPIAVARRPAPAPHDKLVTGLMTPEVKLAAANSSSFQLALVGWMLAVAMRRARALAENEASSTR